MNGCRGLRALQPKAKCVEEERQLREASAPPPAPQFSCPSTSLLQLTVHSCSFPSLGHLGGLTVPSSSDPLLQEAAVLLLGCRRTHVEDAIPRNLQPKVVKQQQLMTRACSW